MTHNYFRKMYDVMPGETPMQNTPQETAKSTGKFDRKGNEIFEGDTLRYHSIYSNENIFMYKVKWSNYRNMWIGDCDTEMYDLSENIFDKTLKEKL